MKRHTVALLVLLVTGVIVLSIATSCRREPEYQGKRLAAWLKEDLLAEAQINVHSVSSRGEHRFEDAVLGLGTNAIPVLLRMLQETESDRAMRFKLAAVNFLNSHHLGHFDYMPMETKHGAAVGGLLALRAAASNSVPTLLRMLHRNNCNPLPEEIPFILAFIGPPAEAAIPMLIEKVSLTNALGRYNSLLALGQIHGRPELSVPVLVKCLEDPDIMFRRAAAWGLQAFGPEARTAEPALAHLVPAWSPTNRAATKAQLGIKSSDPQLEWELMVAADNALAAVHGQ